MVDKNMTKKGLTSIQMDFATRDRLKELGKKGESYAQIINRILDKGCGNHKEIGSEIREVAEYEASSHKS